MKKINKLFKDISSIKEPTREYLILSNVYVNKSGEIYSKKNKSYKKLKLDTNNRYKRIQLKCLEVSTNKKVFKNFRINQIMAQIYLADKMKKGLQVDHIDQNRENNNLKNLQWVTSKHNNKIKFLRAERKYQIKLFKDIKGA